MVRLCTWPLRGPVSMLREEAPPGGCTASCDLVCLPKRHFCHIWPSEWLRPAWTPGGQGASAPCGKRHKGSSATLPLPRARLLPLAQVSILPEPTAIVMGPTFEHGPANKVGSRPKAASPSLEQVSGEGSPLFNLERRFRSTWARATRRRQPALFQLPYLSGTFHHIPLNADSRVQ